MHSAPEGSTAPGHAPARTGHHAESLAGACGDDPARWAAAAQIRRKHAGWVVIWVARKGQYQARPLFRAPPGTVAIGATPEELTARMHAIRQAALRRPRAART
jgi:hypothetical protein